eukprot:6450207-Pyramimonas_sp.AAC.1
MNGQVEINVRQATPGAKANIAEANTVEVYKWMHNEVCQASLRQAGGQPMEMRRRLIMADEGKVKARRILLGLQDPRLAAIDTSSPAVSARGRNHVKAAFLQGDLTQAKHGLPVELAQEIRPAFQVAGQGAR